MGRIYQRRYGVEGMGQGVLTTTGLDEELVNSVTGVKFIMFHTAAELQRQQQFYVFDEF